MRPGKLVNDREPLVLRLRSFGKGVQQSSWITNLIIIMTFKV